MVARNFFQVKVSNIVDFNFCVCQNGEWYDKGYIGSDFIVDIFYDEDIGV